MGGFDAQLQWTVVFCLAGFIFITLAVGSWRSGVVRMRRTNVWRCHEPVRFHVLIASSAVAGALCWLCAFAASRGWTPPH